MRSGNVSFILALLVGTLFSHLIIYSQAPPTMIPHRAVFINQSQAYKLPAAPVPGGAVLVFVNGLLMAPGIDYTLGGATLTFTAQRIGDGPVIQVFYWTAAG